MKSKYSIPLGTLIDEFQLKVFYMPENGREIKVQSPEVVRPGLAFAGFFDVFESHRIQLIGKAEHKFLQKMTPEECDRSLDAFFSKKPVAVIVTSKLTIFSEMRKNAKKRLPAVLTLRLIRMMQIL